MYGLPGSAKQFGAKRARAKPGRKSNLAKFLEKQLDLFPVDLFTSKQHSAANAVPTRSEARMGTAFAAALQQSGEKSTGFDLGFSDLRRCSTADQSGLPDFCESCDVGDFVYFGR